MSQSDLRVSCLDLLDLLCKSYFGGPTVPTGVCEVIWSDLVLWRLCRSGLCCSGKAAGVRGDIRCWHCHTLRWGQTNSLPWLLCRLQKRLHDFIYLFTTVLFATQKLWWENAPITQIIQHFPATGQPRRAAEIQVAAMPEQSLRENPIHPPTLSRTSWVSAAPMRATVKLLISGSCRAIAQAVTSGNEWLTYKGVSLHISAEGGKRSDRNTPESRVSPVHCCQRRAAKLSSSITQDFEYFIFTFTIFTSFTSFALKHSVLIHLQYFFPRFHFFQVVCLNDSCPRGHFCPSLAPLDQWSTSPSCLGPSRE